MDFVKPALIDRHGHAPIYRYFTNEEDQVAFIKNEIEILRNEYSLKEICIVVKVPRLVDSVSSSLGKVDIRMKS